MLRGRTHYIVDVLGWALHSLSKCASSSWFSNKHFWIVGSWQKKNSFLKTWLTISIFPHLANVFSRILTFPLTSGQKCQHWHVIWFIFNKTYAHSFFTNIYSISGRSKRLIHVQVSPIGMCTLVCQWTTGIYVTLWCIWYNVAFSQLGNNKRES